MSTVGAYEAKTHLSALLDRVANGERIVITKHGVPVAVLQPPDARSRRDVRDVIADLRASPSGCGVSPAEIAEWAADGRD